MKIGIATCDFKPQLISSEQYLLEVLKEFGEVFPVIWNNENIDWNSFDVVIIRSTWDYHERLDVFNTWLNMLESSGVLVLNPINIIRNNIHKFYLKTLQDSQLPIIETYFLTKEKSEKITLSAIAETKGWESVVIKPAVSAGAWHTYKLDNKQKIEQFNFPIQSDWLIQPFIPEIITKGEISLMFFNNRFSHAVVKNAKTGDFRIQEEFGGTTTHIDLDAAIIDTAQAIVNHFDETMLYCRVDGVNTKNGFKLMEVELIEPELFLLNQSLQISFYNAIKDNLLAIS